MLVFPLILLLWPSMLSCDEDVLEVDKRWRSLPNWMQSLRHPFLQQWKSESLLGSSAGRRDGEGIEELSYKNSPPVFSLSVDDSDDSPGSIPIWSKVERAIRSNGSPALGPWSKGMARFKLLRLKKWRSFPKMNGRLRLLSSILAAPSSQDPASLMFESPGNRAANQMMLQGPTVIQGVAKPYRL